MTPITEVEGRRLALSNLEKVLHPATGFTKGEVLHYYATTPTPCSPSARPAACPSCAIPDGPDGQVFFTKNPPPGTPDWVTTAPVPRSEDPPPGRSSSPTSPTLVWAANLVAEFHTPQWTAGRTGRRRPAGLRPRPRRRPPPSSSAARSRSGCASGWRRTGSRRTPRPPGRRASTCLAALRPTPSERVSAYAKRLAGRGGARAAPAGRAPDGTAACAPARSSSTTARTPPRRPPPPPTPCGRGPSRPCRRR